MKSAQTLAVIILVACLMSGLHLDAPITCVIPFMGGIPPSIQDVVGVAIIVTTLWGLQHLRRNHSQSSIRTRRFNWGLLLVPAVWILAVWILNHVQPALTWEEILDRFHIQGQERVRMSRLIALSLVCIGAVVIKRIWVTN